MKPRKIQFILLMAVCSVIPIVLNSQSVTDLDGTVYQTIKIGNQTWTGQNLNVSQFRNGDPIPEVKTDEEWEKAGLERKPAWCYYESNSDHGKLYGKLYNWYAVNDKRGLSPKGWHIPSDAEWKTLATFLGGNDLAGKKLKEKGTTHWKSPNKDATNESGFTGLPGGLNYSFGSFVSMGNVGYWWTSDENGEETANLYSLSYEDNILSDLFLNKGVGISVRCIKD